MHTSYRQRVEELIRQRRELGISQADLAARMGTSQPALARLEAPGSDPRLSSVERYATALRDVLVASGRATADRYSVESIEEFMLASFANSTQLCGDARLLLNAGRFSTAYALAELAGEEAGKSLLLLRAGTDLALGNKVDWKELQRRLSDHSAKIGTLMVFDWAVHDQAAAWAAGDLEALLADAPGRRKAASEAREALLLRERALYVEIGPVGLSTPAVAIDPKDARMMVAGAEGILRKMRAVGLPPAKGAFKLIARNPDRRKRALQMRKALNRLPALIPF
jgi:AbiV family abortive infection protein